MQACSAATRLLTFARSYITPQSEARKCKPVAPPRACSPSPARTSRCSRVSRSRLQAPHRAAGRGRCCRSSSDKSRVCVRAAAPSPPGATASRMLAVGVVQHRLRRNGLVRGALRSRARTRATGNKNPLSFGHLQHRTSYLRASVALCTAAAWTPTSPPHRPQQC